MASNLMNQRLLLMKPMWLRKYHLCFSPRKSLEQIIDEFKGKISPVPMNEPNLNSNDKPVVKKIRKGKRFGNIIMNNRTSFKAIINSELSNPSFANF
jgi:hypothetical protein